MAKKVIKSDVLQDRSESHGLITSEVAASLLGVQKASFFAIAYEHAEELGAFRMGGIILCEKAKCQSFAEKRAAKNADKSASNRRKELVEKLADLSSEQIEELLAKVEWKEPALGQELLES